jgi:GT2 family glycosyltransferase/glycosyltransferase involved in cell wall biosynthesis
MTRLSPDQESAPESLATILLDWRRREPVRPLLLKRRDLELPARCEDALGALLEDLQSQSDGPLVLSVLSNAEADLNPFAGLAASGVETPFGPTLANLVALLGPGEVHEWNAWPRHLTLLSPAAVEALAQPDTTAANALARLREAGGRLLLADSIFLPDSRADLFTAVDLQPHEQRRPPAWGALTERLDTWLRSGVDLEDPQLQQDLDRFATASAPITVHVTHSWGGGVERWVESFIEADTEDLDFQLRAEGPETGKGCGQRLALYLGNRLEAPVASWWLQPPIRSTAAHDAGYREILRNALERIGAGRVIVSSLVGHSLDALATGLPTLQVLHDYFPRWPLLGVHPGPYLADGKPVELRRALGDHRLLPEFRDRDAAGWEALGRRWREAVVRNGVRVAAPSGSVVELLGRLDPAWPTAQIEIIPHGLQPLPGPRAIMSKERADGRLRLVIPGRIQEGKGRQLLLEALPELTRHARVCLLGSGKDGELFFGRPEVDVIVQYRREDLAETLEGLGPHVAALLSVVPETFSYTLSEMQYLGIPVIGTRVGSLVERIGDGETGWLIEPTAEALVACVRRLAGEVRLIDGARERLSALDPPDTTQMVERYQALCRPGPAPRLVGREAGVTAVQAAALAFQNYELAEKNRLLHDRTADLQAEVEKRSEWAEERERARQEEVERRIRWVGDLEARLEERFMELQAARDALDRKQAMLNRLQARHDWVLASRSWRWTRPFRVGGRMAANLRAAGAANPFRWPTLVSQSVRTIRTHGLRGALLCAQFKQQSWAPEPIDTENPEADGSPDAPPRLPYPEQPTVSIVIPVHNKWVYTAACLRSLADTPCRIPFEVIVVDDQSTDETADRLAGIDGLVHVRNERNLGFVETCNRGAELARGNYVVMLNNDTEVLEGWLEALLETFEHFPDAGLVGARLVYPDGRLQESGGMVFRDGSGWNYGRNDDPERPEYRYVREVDYCSGACVVLPTTLFRELGGFDRHYAPAYYEDTDLAFRVRARGLRVFVQPAATIVHHEGVTSGTDLGSGTKRFQGINRKKFLKRWRTELERYPEPVVAPEDRRNVRRARDHRLKGRILVIDACTPEPDQDSGSLRLRYLMECFRELGYGVTFLPDNRAPAGRYTTDLQQDGVEAVYKPWISSLERFFTDRAGEFDFVMISRHYVAARYLSLLKRHCPKTRFLFDTVDLHYLREERLAELETSLSLQRAAAQTRRSELSVIEAADATLVVSPVEQAVLREAAPDARVHVISNVHEVVGSRRPFAERKDLFFVGGYQHPPNIDAARWFVGSIWPLIHRELPDVEFHLIGSKAPEEVRSLEGNGVCFHGFVKDLEPWLDGCRIAVAPLRYGAGIKGKVNISMSRGQPVVATPTAVEGMFAKPGRDVMVAETAEEFAAQVVRLYRDEELWNTVSAHGVENVRQYFSVDTARRNLRELLDSFP